MLDRTAVQLPKHATTSYHAAGAHFQLDQVLTFEWSDNKPVAIQLALHRLNARSGSDNQPKLPLPFVWVTAVCTNDVAQRCQIDSVLH